MLRKLLNNRLFLWLIFCLLDVPRCFPESLSLKRAVQAVNIAVRRRFNRMLSCIAGALHKPLAQVVVIRFQRCLCSILNALYDIFTIYLHN